MAILKVARMGHPLLRQVAAAVPADRIGHPAIQGLIDDMVDTMVDEQGIGLAAPQVHESLRLVTLGSPDADSEDTGAVPLTVVINPQWTLRSADTVEGWEGCLSLPGLRGAVPRSRSVALSYLDRHGQPQTIEAEDLLARVLQHEIDHLDGVLYLDRMPDLRRLSYNEEFGRYWTSAGSNA